MVTRSTVPVPASGAPWTASVGGVSSQVEVLSRYDQGAPMLLEVTSLGLPVGVHDVVLGGGIVSRMEMTPAVRGFFGQPLTFPALGEVQWGKWERSGPVYARRRFFGRRCVGWVTGYSGLDFVEVDLVVHVGTPGASPLSFPRLEMLVPGAVGAFHAWPEPNGFGTVLAQSRADGLQWILAQRFMRHWRFALPFSSGAVWDAQSVVEGSSFAVCDAWLEDWAKWMPMGLPLPNLSPSHAAYMNQRCDSEWAADAGAKQNGTTIGTNIVPGQPGGRVGLDVPWGVDYGGTTGGSDREEINRTALYAALTGNPNGLRALKAEFSMVAYRTPIALVDDGGRPCTWEDWRTKGPFTLSGTDGRFARSQQKDLDGPFGFWANRMPTIGSSEYSLAEWDRMVVDDYDGLYPIDWQHFIRFWSPAVGLYQLSGDPIAKWSLQLASEVFKMSMETQGNARGELQTCLNLPGKGTTFGRAQGHGFALCGMAASISSNNWRARWRDLLSRFTDGVGLAQMVENGFRRAHKAYIKDGPPFFDAQGNALYATTTCDEEVYLEVALRACALGLGLPISGVVALAENAFWRCATENGTHGPSDFLAVRPVPRNSTPFATIPARHHEDPSELALVVALARFSGHKSAALDGLTALLAGGSPPLAKLLSKPLDQHIDDTAFLISALQRGL